MGSIAHLSLGVKERRAGEPPGRVGKISTRRGGAGARPGRYHEGMPNGRVVENRGIAPPGTVSVLAARPAIAELDRRGIDAAPALGRARLSRELLAAADGRATRG